MMLTNKVIRLLCQFLHWGSEWPLGRYTIIEITELLRVQGPKSNIYAVGDYLRADGPFEGKNDNFDPISSL
jgi:hypothetical protein